MLEKDNKGTIHVWMDGVNIDIYLGLGRNEEIKPDTSDLWSRLAYKRGAYFLILVITTFYCYLPENL